ncbi:MAG: hypothetical protein V1663_04995 [archaeon]
MTKRYQKFVYQNSLKVRGTLVFDISPETDSSNLVSMVNRFFDIRMGPFKQLINYHIYNGFEDNHIRIDLISRDISEEFVENLIKGCIGYLDMIMPYEKNNRFLSNLITRIKKSSNSSKSSVKRVMYPIRNVKNLTEKVRTFLEKEISLFPGRIRINGLNEYKSLDSLNGVYVDLVLLIKKEYENFTIHDLKRLMKRCEDYIKSS